MSKEIKINNKYKTIINELSQEEFNTLEHNILQDGLREPIMLNEKNEIVDGHNRYAICKKHNIELKTTVKKFDSEEDTIMWICMNQLGRRNLDDKLKKYFIGKYYEANKAKWGTNRHTNSRVANVATLESSEDIAAKFEKPERTVRDDAAFAKAIDSLDESVKKEALNNKKITVKDVKAIAKKTKEQQKKIIDTVVNSKAKNGKEAVNQLKKEEAKEKLEEVSKTFVDNKEIQIFNTDFRETAKTIKDNSIDLILSDPPYPKEFLPLWNDLAVIANRVLKPSGFLICYSGQIYLEEIMNYFTNAGLKYYWLGGLWHKGATAIVQGRNVINEMKPILFYQKLPFKKSKNTFCDLFTNDKQEKALHEWQQGIVTFKTIIERFTEPNDLIFEPFAGSGTTLVAAKELKRKCIGCEVDVSNINIIKGRLS